jgi:L-iditol 2-dehydrogenase
VPDGLPPEVAALAETLAVVLKGYDRTPVRAGERAVVLGTGAVGLLWVRVLSARGARVTAVGRRSERRAKATAMGAEDVLDVSVFEDRLRSEGPTADLVVEAVGSEAAWRLAVDAARAGGRVHLFGGLPRGSTVALDAARLHYDELLLAASFHHTPYHFAEALSLLAGGFLDAAALIEERVALDDLPAFFRRGFEGGRPLKAAVLPASRPAHEEV